MQIKKLAPVVGAVLAALSPAHAAGVAPAKILGPIPVTAQSGEPFRGVSEKPVAGPGLPLPVLQPYGYVEEEYFVSGTVDGRPYETALLVRKPKDRAKFSGVVAV
jgi:Alpha/beta hydrolase domain